VPERDHDLLPKDTASPKAPDLFLEREIPDRTAEYVHRITDLQGRVKILIQQVIVAMDQAKKIFHFVENCIIARGPVVCFEVQNYPT
jgi:hypothetical protein